MASETITRNDLKAILDEVLPTAKALLKERVAVASGLSIAANSVLASTQTKTVTKDGYRPMGIVGMETNNNSVSFMKAVINSDGAIYVRIHNPTSSALSNVSISVDVLWEPI